MNLLLYYIDKIIKFCYFYEFKEKGKYNIKYIFKNNIKNCNYMFYNCNKLTSINLSNFKTNNVTNMRNMFYGCKNLTDNNIIVNDKNLLNIITSH